MPIKTPEGLESAIALKYLRDKVSTSITYKKEDVPPYCATIRQEDLPLGTVKASDLEELQKKIEELIEGHLSGM